MPATSSSIPSSSPSETPSTGTTPEPRSSEEPEDAEGRQKPADEKADVIVMGIPFGAWPAVAKQYGAALKGKIVITAPAREISALFNAPASRYDAQRLTEHEFFGAPWERRELYRRLSPISYVEKVTIPTLIINSEQDWRRPPGDGSKSVRTCVGVAGDQIRSANSRGSRRSTAHRGSPVIADESDGSVPDPIARVARSTQHRPGRSCSGSRRSSAACARDTRSARVRALRATRSPTEHGAPLRR